MSAIEEYPGKQLTIINDAARCIHSRYCVLNLPGVFKPNVEGPWIDPDAAPLEAVIAVISKCPSGALRYTCNDANAAEATPGVNTVRVMEDGPLVVHAELKVGENSTSMRATLCRCGASKNKPYCDHSHMQAKFKATGEPESQASEPLSVRGGPLKVTVSPNGPYMVEGALEICAASGRTVARGTKQFLCRCGQSQNKPFCDGRHVQAGFTDPGLNG